LIALGGIALLLGYLEYQKWISVHWATVENQTSTMITQAAHKVYVVTQQMGQMPKTDMKLLSNLGHGITRSVNLLCKSAEDLESIAGYDDVKNIFGTLNLTDPDKKISMIGEIIATILILSLCFTPLNAASISERTADIY
jgi:hypothetical protein